MELLGELDDKILGISGDTKEEFKIKKSARAVLFNEEDKVAIMYVSKENYHKLPGGSFEGEENLEEALKREVLEETGFVVKDIGQEVGMILEFRSDKNWGTLYINYCLIAKASSEQVSQQFTDFEKELCFELKWMDLDEAINLISNEKPENYNGKFIVARDSIFLKKVKEILG